MPLRCELCDAPARWWIFRDEDPERPVRACDAHERFAGPGDRQPIRPRRTSRLQLGAILSTFWTLRGKHRLPPLRPADF